MTGEGFDDKMYNGGTIDDKIGQHASMDSGESSLGGYNVRDHKRVIDELKKRKQQDKDADKPYGQMIHDKKKDMADAAGITVNPILRTIDDVLSKYNLNPKWDIYGNVMKKHLGQATRLYEETLDELDAHKKTLEGKIRYIPMTAPNIDEYKKRKYVRESDKGLRYKREEIFDQLQIVLLNYEQGDMLKNNFEAKRDSYVSQISELRSQTNPANRSKILDLSASKSVIESDIRTLNEQQELYQDEMSDLECNLNDIEANIVVEEKAIRTTKRFLQNTRSKINGLSYHVKKNESNTSYERLIGKVRALDERTREYEGLLQGFDDILKFNLDQFDSAVPSDGGASRPIVDDILAQKTEDAVVDRELIGRVRSRLGYA